jgi:hypothetical protein
MSNSDVNPYQSPREATPVAQSAGVPGRNRLGEVGFAFSAIGLTGNLASGTLALVVLSPSHPVTCVLIDVMFAIFWICFAVWGVGTVVSLAGLFRRPRAWAMYGAALGILFLFSLSICVHALFRLHLSEFAK